MRYSVRCRKCETRNTLSRHPEDYQKFDRKKGHFVNKAPICAGCGKNDWRIDRWMMRRNTKEASCDCAGYVHLTRRVWPHRKGSKYCWYRTDGSQRVEGDQDFNDSRIEEFLYNQTGE